jgi:hypothetical protein
LPLPHCSKADKSLKRKSNSGQDVSEKLENENNCLEIQSTKRVKFSDDVETSKSISYAYKAASIPHKPPSLNRGSGLARTVQDLIKSYIPTSSERRPFWCRVCSYQGLSENDFFQHKESESHKFAADLERKASKCKLCRKQFTSPDQLKEHLKGKLHLETLQRTKEKQYIETSSGKKNVKFERI